eukprot:scaffold21119_cov57-Phaeocystis_antarctica.AAC.1
MVPVDAAANVGSPDAHAGAPLAGAEGSPRPPTSAVSTLYMSWLSSAGVALPAACRSSRCDMRRQPARFPK